MSPSPSLPAENKNKPSGMELLLLQFGPISLFAAGLVGMIGTLRPDIIPPEETKKWVINLALVAIGLTTMTLPRIFQLFLNSQEEQNKDDFWPALETLKQPVSLELAEAVKELPPSTLALGQLPLGNYTGKIIGVDSPLAATADILSLLKERKTALIAVISALNPSSLHALTALTGLSELFSFPTSTSGIKLLPSEKRVIIELLKLLPTFAPDQFLTSDLMVDYLSGLVCVYSQIFRSYLHQISVDLVTASDSLKWDILTNLIRVESLGGRSNSSAMIGSITVQQLRRLEKARSLLSEEEAVMMAKLIIAIWFQALPAARTTATGLITPLKQEVNRLLGLRLPQEEIERLNLIKKIFSLPDQWPRLLRYSETVADPELRKLIKRIEEASEIPDLLEPIRGKDNTLRGKINSAIKHWGIKVEIVTRTLEDSMIVIKSDKDHLASIAEQIAICEALLFPGIKKLRMELKGYQPIEVEMDEFYLNRIVNGDTGYIRRLLRRVDDSAIVTA